MYENRIQHLRQMHHDLLKQISNLDQFHPHADEVHLADLKKRRLQIKDELFRLMRLQWEEITQRVEYDDDH